VTTLTVIPSQS